MSHASSAGSDDESEAQSSHSSDSSDDDRFLPTVEAINREALVSVALAARRNVQGDLPDQASSNHTLSCTIETQPFTGTSHLVYPILFSDGEKWIARIPGKAVSCFRPLDARRLLTDVRTRCLIRSRTTVPIPEVFAWETSIENPVGVPFTLEAFVEGSAVAEKWSGMAEGMRLKLLRNLAAIMSELHALRFDKIGALEFGDEGSVQVGSMVSMACDMEAMYQGEQLWPRAVEHGPFATAKDYLSDLNKPDSSQDNNDWDAVQVMVIGLAIDSLPDFVDRDGAFNLQHPDFDSQNILIDDEGTVTGIIDWDCLQTAPRALGFARYPAWITLDWNPGAYYYGMSDCPYVDSPEQLLRYRREYAEAFADRQIPAPNYSPSDTTLSQIFEVIGIASGFQMRRPWIVEKLVKFAFDDKLPFDFRQFHRDYLVDGAADRVEAIRKAFATMWHPEWEEGITSS